MNVRGTSMRVQRRGFCDVELERLFWGERYRPWSSWQRPSLEFRALLPKYGVSATVTIDTLTRSRGFRRALALRPSPTPGVTTCLSPTSTNTVTATVSIGISSGVAIAPSGSCAYVTNYTGNSVSVHRHIDEFGDYDCVSRNATPGSQVRTAPCAYVTNRPGAIPCLSSTSTNSVTAVTVGSKPEGSRLHRALLRIRLNSGSNSVSVSTHRRIR